NTDKTAKTAVKNIFFILIILDYLVVKISLSGIAAAHAIASSFSGLPPPATPMLPITLPRYQTGTPPLSSRSSGRVLRLFVSGLALAFLSRARVAVLVDTAV